jgi:hypothetical protein
MPLAKGTRFGRYEIVATVGAGGMGEVYRARDCRLERDVAIIRFRSARPVRVRKRLWLNPLLLIVALSIPGIAITWGT